MAERIKYYLDEIVPRAVARGLRARGVDVLTVPEAGTLGVSDGEHLNLAKTAGRVLFTQDVDFLRLHEGKQEHAGIAFAAPGTSIGDIIRGLMLIHQVLDADEMKGHLEYL